MFAVCCTLYPPSILAHAVALAHVASRLLLRNENELQRGI